IPNVILSAIDYVNYRKKFPSQLRRGGSFSNRVKIHDTLMERKLELQD
ncbi:29744_t:CDS:1, partial [Gigaspora margarita]